MRDVSTVPVQRLMALRQYPGFAEAELGELAVLADNVVEEDFAAGSIIARAGRVPPIHLITQGRIEMGGRSAGPRELVGAIEAMAGRGLAVPMIAATDTRTLQLGAADFADILEDNLGLLSNVRRGVARRLLAAGHARSGPAARMCGSIGPLGLVDRLLALRYQLPFANGTIQALAALAETTREHQWAPGALLVHAGDVAADAHVILEGAVRIRGSDRVLGPGDAVGTIECLAEVLHTGTAEALMPVRALQVSAASIFDLIEDHTDLGLAVIASMAGELLVRPPRDPSDVN